MASPSDSSEESSTSEWYPAHETIASSPSDSSEASSVPEWYPAHESQPFQFGAGDSGNNHQFQFPFRGNASPRNNAHSSSASSGASSTREWNPPARENQQFQFGASARNNDLFQFGAGDNGSARDNEHSPSNEDSPSDNLGALIIPERHPARENQQLQLVTRDNGSARSNDQFQFGAGGNSSQGSPTPVAGKFEFTFTSPNTPKRDIPWPNYEPSGREVVVRGSNPEFGIFPLAKYSDTDPRYHGMEQKHQELQQATEGLLKTSEVGIRPTLNLTFDGDDIENIDNETPGNQFLRTTSALISKYPYNDQSTQLPQWIDMWYTIRLGENAVRRQYEKMSKDADTIQRQKEEIRGLEENLYHVAVRDLGEELADKIVGRPQWMESGRGGEIEQQNVKGKGKGKGQENKETEVLEGEGTQITDIRRGSPLRTTDPGPRMSQPLSDTLTSPPDRVAEMLTRLNWEHRQQLHEVEEDHLLESWRQEEEYAEKIAVLNRELREERRTNKSNRLELEKIDEILAENDQLEWEVQNLIQKSEDRIYENEKLQNLIEYYKESEVINIRLREEIGRLKDEKQLMRNLLKDQKGGLARDLERIMMILEGEWWEMKEEAGDQSGVGKEPWMALKGMIQPIAKRPRFEDDEEFLTPGESASGKEVEPSPLNSAGTRSELPEPSLIFNMPQWTSQGIPERRGRRPPPGFNDVDQAEPKGLRSGARGLSTGMPAYRGLCGVCGRGIPNRTGTGNKTRSARFLPSALEIIPEETHDMLNIDPNAKAGKEIRSMSAPPFDKTQRKLPSVMISPGRKAPTNTDQEASSVTISPGRKGSTNTDQEALCLEVTHLRERLEKEQDKEISLGGVTLSKKLGEWVDELRRRRNMRRDSLARDDPNESGTSESGGGSSSGESGSSSDDSDGPGSPGSPGYSSDDSNPSNYDGDYYDDINDEIINELWSQVVDERARRTELEQGFEAFIRLQLERARASWVTKMVLYVLVAVSVVVAMAWSLAEARQYALWRNVNRNTRDMYWNMYTRDEAFCLTMPDWGFLPLG